MNPDPRTEADGICGVTLNNGGAIEWVCIAPVHDIGYRRRGRGDVAYGTGAHPERPRGVRAAPADRHHMVNRWPNRRSE